MATIAVQVVTEEIEKISAENVVSETHSETVTEALVALPSKNTDADSGILTCTNSNNEKFSQPEEVSLTGKNLSDEQTSNLSQESNKLTLDSRCSQESRTSSCTAKSSYSSVSKKSKSASSRYTNENSNFSYSSTVKGSQKLNNEDEDSRSSISSSTSTIKTSQYSTYKSDDESNSRFSFKSSNKRSSPEKQSDNANHFKRSQSVHSENSDSSSTTASSNSRSTTKNSQPVSKDSSPEKASDSKKRSPAKESDGENSQPKKYFNLIDSDSEDDIIIPQRSKANREQSGSDSDGSKSSKSPKSGKKLKSKNKRKLIDSDSDEESVKTEKSSRKEHTDTETSDNESEKEESKSVNKSNKLSNIIDSDSESGNDNHSVHRSNASSGEENDAGKTEKQKKSEKKRTGTARASKDAAMQQIHSETQRLMREAEISLPYHRPKQRTLQEFLNRKKITSNIPKNLTFAEKVKMFPEVISKVVKEKEEEAEIFYKSSDSEEEQDVPMEVDEAVTCKKDNENKNEKQISTAIGIADTQKLTQDHIQDSNDKMTILQQRSLDFGVPRKLFLEDNDENERTKSTRISEERANTDESINTDITALEKKLREVKSGIREASIPRKLFTGQELEMDVDTNEDDVDISEEKCEENPKMLENIENIDKTDEKTNKVTLENSNEEIVLNFSETEHDINDSKQLSESSKHRYLEKNKSQESIVISETPFISNKEIAKTNKLLLVSANDEIIPDNIENESSNKEEQKDTDDLILKLASVSKDNDDDEIIDRDILRANFALPQDLEEPVVMKKPSLKETILANALKNRPMIKASPGSTIDFSNGSDQMKEGVTQLLDRFARHSTIYRPKVNEISEVKTIRTEGTGNDITIVEEVLPFSKTMMEGDPKKDRKPGERLQKLKEDLKRKIASVRNEEWKQREEKDKEEEEEEAKCKGEDFYEGLPDEEEELEDEISTESEPEENDVPMKESRRPKCAFGDEEAEESEDENAAAFGDNENGDDEDNEEEDEEAEDEEEEEEPESEKEEINDKPKKLKRIIRPFDEDSNESKSSLSNGAKPTFFPGSNRVRNKTDEDMFASQVSNGSEDLEADSIPPFQSRDRCGSDSRSQACKTPLPKPSNLLSMVSPVTQLTALNTSHDSTKKSASKTPNTLNLGPISALVENTPTEDSANRPQTNCSMEKMMGLQKKLFDDPSDIVNDDELLEICSGRFTNTQSSGRPPNIMSQSGVTDSQLMELCSGAFVSQPVNIQKLESDNVVSSRPEFGDETSQDITLTLDDDDDSKSSPTKTVSSLKRSDESMFSSDSKSPIKLPTFGGTSFKNPLEAWLKRGNDKPTAEIQQKQDQVTDSQLMDLCSGEFTSQAVNFKALEENDSPQIHDDASQDFNLTLDDNTKNAFKKALQSQKNNLTEQPKQKVTLLDDDSNAPRTSFAIVSSSDEEDREAKEKRPKKKLIKKKKVKKLTLSDDEDEDEAKEFSDEEESEIEEEDDEEKFVDYDSEENEVVVVPKKEIKKVAKNFLENEAELSESDWDSADEDEQGMDKLEFEEADAEEIDEDKMKEQLDRVHMKQVMDEDQREVRMLQELLFDDGDLHSEGAGRERKFKWKNIDSLGDLGLTPRTDDNGEIIDDEVDTEMEVQMRKVRYEQQKFLEEKGKSLDVAINEDFSENQLFNRGLKVVTVRSTSKTSTEEQKLVKSNSVANSTNILMAKGVTRVTKKTFSSTKSLSFSNMKGSFLSRGDETLVRIAQNLPEKGKMSTNAGRKGNFVFQHLSPSVSNAPKDDSEQENNDTPAKEKNKRKRKMFGSQISGQTPRNTKKLKVDDRTAGKKLF